MDFHALKLRSLKTRVTLGTLALFLGGMWSLAFYASHILREDTQRMSGEQQLSTATYIAAATNDELGLRLRALEEVAAHITQELMSNPSKLQDFLDNRQALNSLFNRGTLVSQLNGNTIATFPLTSNRIGMNFIERDAIAAAIKEGKTSIGRPVLAKNLPIQVLLMATPLLNRQGHIIGALTGVTQLDAPNFLDKIAKGSFGKTGAYVLAAPQHRLFVTGSNPKRALQAFPAPGATPLFDQFSRGEEGYGVLRNAEGQEELMAAKNIPLAGWFIGISLPTVDAFAPIRDMQSRMLQGALVLTLLAGSLTWWMLNRQLSPMLSAVARLSLLRGSGSPLSPLPIARDDEIGDLLASFNHLIETVVQRERALTESKAFKQTILNSVGAEIAVLDGEGTILAVNEPWLRFARENQTGTSPPLGVGANYLANCIENQQRSGGALTEVCAHIQAVMRGDLPSYNVEYLSQLSQQFRWYNLSVTPMHGAVPDGVVVTHLDITERKRAEELLRDSEKRLRLALDAADIGEWEMDLATLQTVRSRRHGEIFGQSEPLAPWDFSLFLDHVHPEDRAKVRTSIQSSMRSGLDWHLEFRIVQDDQRVRWVWAKGHIFRDQQGKPHKMHGMVSDFTERKQAEEALQHLNDELARSHQTLRDLAAQTEAMREAERKHIAREVHDELGQVLTALRMDISLLGMRFGTLDPALPDKLLGMKHLVDRAIQGVRNVAMNLRPVALDMGLIPALEWLCGEYTRQTQVPCALQAREESIALDETRAVVVFRIVQESLTNITRYAQASQVNITIDRRGNELWVVVRDNGQGFDVNVATSKQSFGLLGMRERALALGGQVNIDSTPGQGTVIAVTIPIALDDTEGKPI